MLGLGALAHRTGQVSAARKCYQAALTLAEALSLPELARVLHTNMGSLAESAGELAAAERCYVAAIRIIESGRRTLSAEQLRVTYLSLRVDPLEHMVTVAWRQNQPINSLNWCEAGRSRVFLDQLHAGFGIGTFADPESFTGLRALLSTDALKHAGV